MVNKLSCFVHAALNALFMLHSMHFLIMMAVFFAVEQYREHNPYAKQYETTVQHTGRERLIGTQIEALGTTVGRCILCVMCLPCKNVKTFSSWPLIITACWTGYFPSSGDVCIKNTD